MKRRISDDWRGIMLSDNFLLGEFVDSKQHPEYLVNFKPTWEQADRLFFLANLALQPIRDIFGPLKITRGLVTEELNTAQGGVPDSQHLFGEAADIISSEKSMFDVFIFCKNELKWKGELIYYKKKGHCHIALPSLFVVPDHIIKEV